MPHCGISRAGGCDVVALSRRRPRDLHGARHVPIDLTDATQCTQAATVLRDTTHLVYAALYVAVDGWRDSNQIRSNDLMLRNLMAALEPVAPQLRHVALQARSNLAGTGSVRRHVIPVCRLQHVARPDPAGAAFDRFDAEDQPGQAGFTGRRTPSPLPCAS
jgi:hypothetical protein